MTDVVDLAQVIVSEEIRRVRRDRWSGVLAMTQGEVTKGLYFVDGEIAFAASTVEEDRLGANLYRIGRITESQFRSALSAAQEPGRRVGQALIEAGILSQKELAGAVTGQVERIVLSVLRWTNGSLQRRAMDRPIPADLALDLNTPRLLLLGARLFPDADRLEKALGSPKTRLRRVVPRPFSYDMLAPSPPERAVLAMCAREASLSDILKLPHPRARLVRAAYALVAGGLIEQREEKREEKPMTVVPPPTAEIERLVPTQPPVTSPDWTSARPPGLEPEEPTVEDEPEVPLDPNTAEQKAQVLLERGQRAAAAELLAEVVARHPEASRCRRLLAMSLAQEPGFRAEVEEHFVAALEADSKDTELRYRLATYYRRAGMRARAMLQLRLVLSADPSHAAAWRDLGELEAGEGRRGR